MKNAPNTSPIRLAVVVPCYCEEQVLDETTFRLSKILDSLIADGLITENSYILYINDGSTDRTWEIISHLHDQNRYVCGVSLAANTGHQNALIAGLSVAVNNSDAIITIDADLQDDVNTIRDMVLKHVEGIDIVYGVRNKRDTDTWFKRTTALGFYRLMKTMGIRSVYNHADYRLMSKRAVNFLLQYHERNLFLRGLVPLIGYKTDCVYYERSERFAGNSKYPLRKMLHFAVDGITSFSVKPLHLVLYAGLALLTVAFVLLVRIIILSTIRTLPPQEFLMLSLWFCTGCIMTGLGIIGVYIGRIYTEVKQRPRYNIETVLLKDRQP